jgi:hypothetical protein
VIAYFIGGSWDLTKTPMQHCPPVWQVVKVPQLSAKFAPSPADLDVMETVKVERELYVRARHDHEKEIAIYIFDKDAW